MVNFNDSLQIEYYDVKEAPRIIEYIIENNPPRWLYSKKCKCLDISIAYDIEASSFIDNKKKVALQYTWQVCIYSDSTDEYFVFFGRENSEYEQFIKILEAKYGIKQRNENYFKLNGRRVKSDARKRFYKEDDNGISLFDKIKQTDRYTPLYIKETKEYEEITLNIYVETTYKEWLSRARGYYIPIFIHNAGYEFSYLRANHPEQVHDTFAVRPQVPLYFRMDYIEYRCSYLLSGTSLKELPTVRWKKQDGDLDYQKLRTPKTPLTDEEIGYCLADVLTLAEYITIMRQRDGDITKMEYTKTGYVRRGLRHACCGDGKSDEDYYKKQDYIKLVAPLCFHSIREYLLLRRAFMGGHTAASTWYSNRCKPVENVTCIDFTSSYPAIICSSKRFPLYLFEYRPKSDEETYNWFRKRGYAIVSQATFKNLRSKLNFDSPIPSSKVLKHYTIKEGKKIETQMTVNNGKVAEYTYYEWEKGKDEPTQYPAYLEIAITEVDYEIFKEFYTWDEVTFEYCYIYCTGYLPKAVIDYTLQRYAEKTTLKGVEGKEILYNLGKELLNSIYGAMVQDPCKVQPILDVESGKWTTKNIYIGDDHEEEVKEKIDRYNKKIREGYIPCPYIWGIYVTAIARYNLFTGLKAAGQLGYWVYADTDSLYIKDIEDFKAKTKEVLGKDYISYYNDNIIKKLDKMCEHYGFDKEIYQPETKKHIKKPIGVWDYDGDYKLFKTLGAKRYCVLTKDNDFKITVAGQSKQDGAEYLASTYGKGYRKYTDEKGVTHYHVDDATEIFEKFTNQLEIPAGESGKFTHTILTTYRKGTVTDYLGNEYEYESKGGTYLSPTSFSMSIEKIYLDYLFQIQEEEGN